MLMNESCNYLVLVDVIGVLQYILKQIVIFLVLGNFVGIRGGFFVQSEVIDFAFREWN